MKRRTVLLGAALCVGALATALHAQGVVVQLRAASGALTAGESTTAVPTRFARLAFLLNVTTITTPDGDDEVDFYLQTTYDGGTTWCDVENIHFAVGDTGTTAKLVLRIGHTDYLAADVGAACTDGTLADDTKLKLPLGNSVRIKTAITGATAPTYAYSAAGNFS